jgi:hypothetical protein
VKSVKPVKAEEMEEMEEIGKVGRKSTSLQFSVLRIKFTVHSSHASTLTLAKVESPV